MLNITIIGCGAVAEDLHVVPLKKLRAALQVTALIDRDPVRAEKLKRQFPGATIFKSPAEAFNAGKVDITFVASPPGLHFEHSMAALSANSHVFCEKPMVTNSNDAERLTEAARKANRLLGVALPRRFYPNVAEIAQRIKKGELGNNLTFIFREGGPFSWPVASDAAFRRQTSGGGVLMDAGVHSLDQLDQLFGRAEVISSRDDSLRAGVETNSVLELYYPESNACGTLQLSWEQVLNNGIWIRGDRAEVWVRHDDIAGYRFRSKGGDWSLVRSSVEWPSSTLTHSKRETLHHFYDCFVFEWVGFVRSILHGEPLAVDGAKATRVIRTIETAYQRAEHLDLPWLSASERVAHRAQHWKAAI